MYAPPLPRAYVVQALSLCVLCSQGETVEEDMSPGLHKELGAQTGMAALCTRYFPSDSPGLSLWHALSKLTNSGSAPLTLAADRLCCKEQSTS